MSYQKQVNAQTGAMGPTVAAEWRNTGAVNGKPWNLSAQPLYFNSRMGDYQTAYEQGADRQSISFGFGASSDLSSRFGKPVMQYFSKAMVPTRIPGFGRRRRSRRRTSRRVSRKVRRHTRRSHRKSHRKSHRRTHRRTLKTPKVPSINKPVESGNDGFLQRMKDRINRIIGRKASEFGFSVPRVSRVKTMGSKKMATPLKYDKKPHSLITADDRLRKSIKKMGLDDESFWESPRKSSPHKSSPHKSSPHK